MNTFGNAALTAVEAVISRKIASPINAWSYAVKLTFPHSESVQKKGCPKSTFLGLCENGLIKHIPAGKYTRSIKNKEYGLIALNLLIDNPSLCDNKDLLWQAVTMGKDITPNHQMEIVISLWKSNLLVHPE